MPDCNLSIELERPGGPFRPGEPIRGLVRVQNSDRVRANMLSVRMAWRTHGKGNTVSDGDERQELYSGEWLRGGSSYSFEFTAPDGPLTYRGLLLNVDWFIEARADVPWAIDPKAEAEFELVPWTELVPSAGANHYRGAALRAWESYSHGPEMDRVAGKSTRAGEGFFGVLGAAILIGGGVALISGVLCLGAMLIAVGASFVFASYMMWHSRKSLGGAPRFEIVPMAAPAGTRVEARVVFTPTKLTRLEDTTFTLTCREEVVRGSGTNKSTFRHELWKREETAGHPGIQYYGAGREVVLSAAFDLPPDAAPSFAARDNQVRWSIAAKVDAVGAPAWNEELIFVVRPRNVA